MRPKETVFIDTSVFEGENFFAPGNRIKILSDFSAKGQISILMPVITECEVRKHIRNKIKQAYKDFNKNCRSLRNIPEIDKIWREGNESTRQNQGERLFDEFLKRGTVIKLGYDYCDDVKGVFDKYFLEEKPFNNGNKKSEFPDAFVLSALEKYAKILCSKIVVLSNDKDMTKYSSEYFEIIDIKDYVLEILTDDKIRTGIKTAINDKGQMLEDKISELIYNELNDDNTYTSIPFINEVTSIDINDYKSRIISDSFYIVSENTEYFTIEIKAVVSFDVELGYSNYDYAIYDREDGVWYGVEEGTERINNSKEIKVVLNYNFTSKDKDHGEIEIEEIDPDDISSWICDSI